MVLLLGFARVSRVGVLGCSRIWCCFWVMCFAVSGFVQGVMVLAVNPGYGILGVEGKFRGLEFRVFSWSGL